MGILGYITGDDDNDIDFTGSGKGKNNFFSKPFGTGSGSVSEFFSPTNPDVGAARHKVEGFNRAEIAAFSKAAGSLATARKRVNPDEAAPQLQSQNLTTREFNKGLRDGFALNRNVDQLKGFIASFSARQDEVFGKRAKPGIAQTRLV